jgi:glycosyltransferase involved in cell wall biosynthesis
MIIGVDLRVLQVGHQYRGIGEVTKRTLDGIFSLALSDDKNHEFVFCEYDIEDDLDPKDLLHIPEGLSYREVFIGQRPTPEKPRSKKQRFSDRQRKLFTNPLPGFRDCDVFLQFDHDLGVPTDCKTILIEHDIIPYIFWKDYFISPWLHVKHKAARTTIRELERNITYKRNLKRSIKNASKIVCVSEHTKQDLHTYLHVPLKKMQTIHLGVSRVSTKNGKAAQSTSALPAKPYLLFIGAVDARRRRVDDIVDAFNNLKAEGHDIQLVLAGENFQSPETVPNPVVHKAIMASSYKTDILTLGYIDDATKLALYKHALAFVFPTTYEGFGIPVLESMLMGCPVIVYRNSSIPEVGGNAALYAKDWTDIKRLAEDLLQQSAPERLKIIEAGRNQAAKFSWDKTARELYKVLVN